MTVQDEHGSLLEGSVEGISVRLLPAFPLLLIGSRRRKGPHGLLMTVRVMEVADHSLSRHGDLLLSLQEAWAGPACL